MRWTLITLVAVLQVMSEQIPDYVEKVRKGETITPYSEEMLASLV